MLLSGIYVGIPASVRVTRQNCVPVPAMLPDARTPAVCVSCATHVKPSTDFSTFHCAGSGQVPLAVNVQFNVFDPSKERIGKTESSERLHARNWKFLCSLNTNPPPSFFPVPSALVYST